MDQQPTLVSVTTDSSPRPRGAGLYVHPSRDASLERFFTLLGALVRRDVAGRYRRSWIGPAWLLLQAFLIVSIFALVRSALGIQVSGAPYVLFVFAGLVPWLFFSNAITRATTSVRTNSGVVKKMAVRLEVFPASGVASSLVDAGALLVMVIPVMAWYRVTPTWSLLWIPVLLALTTLLALGVSFLIASVSTFRDDMTLALPFLLQILMLATPIMYPLERVPQRFRPLFDYNPMVGVIDGFRSSLLGTGSPDLRLIGVAALTTLAVWLVGWPLFRGVGRYFADVL
jgi:lipopolysaccharide transport system permease protein